MAKAVKKAESATKKAASNSGFMAPLTASPALAAVIGDTPMARTAIVKKIWEYIKAHGLQDQKNKRMINADAKLKLVFGGKDQISMFELAKLINQHVK